MDTKRQIQELQELVFKLQAQVNDLTGQISKNNFASTQTFNKASIFGDRLRVPVFSTAPTVAEIGDIYSTAAGVLYICTTQSTGGVGAVWTKVGAQ
jgi:hypothetical protein